MIHRLTETGRSYEIEMYVEKAKVMRIWRELSPLQKTIDQKQQENVEYLNCLGSTITNYAGCICQIKARTAMAKAAIGKKKILSTSQIDLNLKKKLVKCYIWSTEMWCWNVDTSKSRSEIPGKFWNVVLVKEGDQLEHSCKKWKSIIQGGSNMTWTNCDLFTHN
jgi:hypothetical protein